MDRSIGFWDRIADNYSKQPIKDEAAYEKKLAVTRQYFTPDMEVMEFGCGTGSTAVSHAPFVKHILATDISANMIEIGRNRALEAGVDNVTFQQGTLDELEVPPGSLDAVLGLNILHLLEDKEAALTSVHEFLKPGGVFVSSTVCITGFMRIIKYVSALLRPFGLIPRVDAFGRGELEDSIRGAGFEIDYIWQPEGSMGVFIVAKKE